MPAKLYVKVNFGSVHMEAARDFASKCAEIEDDQKHLPWPQPRYNEAARYSSATVILSVAALEAAINEIFLAAADHSETVFGKDRPEKTRCLAKLWNETDRKLAILEKHQRALEAFDVATFDRGCEPFQSAEDLVRLRNSLVHFQPEWDYKLDTHSKLEKRLRSRFAESELWKQRSGQRVWFPDRCLGAGCARWACHTVARFHSDFAQRMGIEPRLK